MRISAIVPTHNRPVVLRECLETLQKQDVDPTALEVVVVDDGSDSDIAAVVATTSARGPIKMRCERLALTGLNGARNHGASAATGEVLAFLDDDTLVSGGWAAALIEAFDRHACAAVGGKVELRLAGPAPEWLGVRRYYLAEYNLGPEPFWIETDLVDGRDPLPVGANCAVRRVDFKRLGGFRLGLDRIGGSLVSNGDTEFFRRLRALGGRMRYEPRAAALHCVPADRLTVRYFTKRYYAQGVSDELLRRLEGEPASLGHRWQLVQKLGEQAKLLSKDVLRGRGSVNGRFEVNYWAGRLSAVGKRPPEMATSDSAHRP
jgi:glycosyltransferase involved in cell wall biosynthesis